MAVSSGAGGAGGTGGGGAGGASGLAAGLAAGGVPANPALDGGTGACAKAAALRGLRVQPAAVRLLKRYVHSHPTDDLKHRFKAIPIAQVR